MGEKDKFGWLALAATFVLWVVIGFIEVKQIIIANGIVGALVGGLLYYVFAWKISPQKSFYAATIISLIITFWYFFIFFKP